MPEEGIPLMQHKNILTFEEIYEFTKTAVKLGINKVRITGGEPLVRKGIDDLVKMLAGIEGIDDLGMTTNGILLEEYADKLAEAGLDRINISMDTLNPEKYKAITRGGELSMVLRGIFAANKAMLLPIKINCVIRSKDDLNDARELQLFAKRYDFKVRMIHLMNLEKGMFTQVDGGEGGNCGECNRLRLTADGHILPCLFSNIRISIRESSYEQAILKAVESKPHSGKDNCVGTFYNIGG
jgi:cyclic pyranopterin phosphate synthase